MPIKPHTILAINPGSKEIGVAILAGLELHYFGVKTIKQRSSPQAVLTEATRLLERLMQDYAPTILAIEQSFGPQQNAALFTVTLAQCKATARQHGLQVYEYAPPQVRKFFCQTGKATKRETARRLVARYPELGQYLFRQTKSEIKYWSQMFDAVAVGLMCALQLSARSGDTPDSS